MASHLIAMVSNLIEMCFLHIPPPFHKQLPNKALLKNPTARSEMIQPMSMSSPFLQCFVTQTTSSRLKAFNSSAHVDAAIRFFGDLLYGFLGFCSGSKETNTVGSNGTIP